MNMKEEACRRAIICKLDKELKRLQGLLGLECNFQVCWQPDIYKGVAGEFKDGVIYIYEADENRAVEVLRHELVDYLLTTRLVKPLVGLINLLIKCRESEIYREKERLVNMFCKLLDPLEA